MKATTKNKSFWIFGKHSVFSAISNSKRIIKRLLIDADNSLLEKDTAAIINLCKRKITIEKTTKKHVQNLAIKNTKHQGIAALVTRLEVKNFYNIFKNNQYKTGVLLEGITDPNNVGAIYRSAYSFNIDFIITLDNGSIRESTSLINNSCGTFDKMQSYSAINCISCIKSFKKNNWWVVGTDVMGSLNIDRAFGQYNESDKVLIVLGSEGKGLKRTTKLNCDYLVKIPMNKNNNSLNVSNAAAIVFYEAFKLYN